MDRCQRTCLGARDVPVPLVRRGRHRRVRPYIDHSAMFWQCPAEGCEWSSVNPVDHPCPFPPDEERPYVTDRGTCGGAEPEPAAEPGGEQVPQKLPKRVPGEQGPSAPEPGTVPPDAWSSPALRNPAVLKRALAGLENLDAPPRDRGRSLVPIPGVVPAAQADSEPVADPEAVATRGPEPIAVPMGSAGSARGPVSRPASAARPGPGAAPVPGVKAGQWPGSVEIVPTKVIPDAPTVPLRVVTP